MRERGEAAKALLLMMEEIGEDGGFPVPADAR